MRHKESTSLGLISGTLLGGGLMYLADPDRGRRRRAMVRDQMVNGARLAGDAVDKGIRDMRNRARGLVFEARDAIWRREVSDEVLVERVRTKLGRMLSHPSAVEVTVEDGRVVLSGPVLESEADDLVAAVYGVRGVCDVESRLETHKTEENVPGLQGARTRTRARPEILQENWAPGTRLLVGAGGLLAVAFPSRNPSLAWPGRIMGGLLMARALTNLPLRRFFGLRRTGRGFRLEKTISIQAPVDSVFKFWSNPENFPRVMEHVQEVKRTDDNRFRWVVSGAAGTSVAWTSRIVQAIPNRLLSWASEPGSLIRSGGIIHFEPAGENSTRVHMLISYDPPAGAIGKALASLFGIGAKRSWDEDLARVKSLFEIGKTTAHGETVTREQLTA